MSEEQYIAVTTITRTPVILAGSLVPVGDGPGDVHPDELPIYLAAGVIRRREPKQVAVTVEETAEKSKKRGGK
jgi:hypothetical protein